ncbi:MAG: TetR/AcrR family transcriptional regulator [Agathobacter sp.]|nr:TetR/AcrR family transcriptional regulator [Lachnospiraceae bacterium]MDY2621187.1 TetR/AcrR family transcriptional regulator [Agathobacter sp.]
MAEKKIHDSKTKTQLMKCAKKEFMEKGFQGASLRSICQKAGVTTGALYFFFQDKDDLFCEVVGDFMDRLNAIIREHFSFEVQEMKSGKATEHDESSDFESMAQIVHELYTYRDEVLLVLTKSQGSSMEHMLDRLVDQMDEHNAFICEAMCQAYGVPMVEKNVVHWMSHSQIDMFIFMVTHIDNEEEALQFAEKGGKYLLAGWYGLVKS